VNPHGQGNKQGYVCKQDKIGARRVMYVTFLSCLTCLFILSYPATDYTVHGIEGDINFSMQITLVPFVILTIFLGFFMSLGKAAVYKHIPVYYPDHVGSVGGLVAMIGGLGGFILPICFGFMNDMIGVWTSCFMLLFIIVGVSVIWMHTSIVLSDRRLHPELKGPKHLPEMLNK
jgi:NNP family nitrate/nitrite transporter-like MFS transporter